MFNGVEEMVTLEIDNDMCGVLIDRFGKDITFVPVDANHSRVRLKVALSDHFLGWIFALGEGVKIVGSKEAVEKAKAMIRRLNESYGE